MKTGTLAVISAAALGVVGYTLWTLTADRGETKAVVSPEDPAAERAAARERRGQGGIKRVEPTVDGDARRKAKSGPAPRPVPKVSLETARADFVAVIASYDKLLDGGAPVDSDEWVKLYAAGADAILPLQQHLDWNVPEQAQELQRVQSEYRTKIDKLQAQVQVPKPAQ